MKLPSICVVLSGFFCMIAAVFGAFKEALRRSLQALRLQKRTEGLLSFPPLSMLLPAAVAFGSVGGLYIYDMCGSVGFLGTKTWEVRHRP